MTDRPTEDEIGARAATTAYRRLQCRAQGAVKYALKTGRLVRPDTCSRCGKKPKPRTDGLPTIQAHHEDHTKKLDVQWLCFKCHRAVTPWPEEIYRPEVNGTKNGNAKLTEQAVLDIRTKQLRAIDYAEKYNVSIWAIEHVWYGRSWTHVRPKTGAGGDNA